MPCDTVSSVTTRCSSDRETRRSVDASRLGATQLCTVVRRRRKLKAANDGGAHYVIIASRGCPTDTDHTRQYVVGGLQTNLLTDSDPPQRITDPWMVSGLRMTQRM